MKAFSALGRSREAVGLTVGALILASWPFRVAMVETPAWLLLTIVFLASMAGFLVGGAAADEGLESPRAVRLGVWSAAVTGIVAASLFALMSRSVSNPIFVLRAMLGAALSIIPAMFYGMFAAGVAALTCARAAPPTSKPESSQFALPSSAVGVLRIVIMLLVLLGVFSPLTLLPPPAPTPIQVSAPRPVVPTPPPFTYAVTAEMALAHAPQWKLSTTRWIPDVDGKHATLSQDGRWLACAAKNDQSVLVFDLHSPDTSKQSKLADPVDRLSFSPTADRLFVTGGGAFAELYVIDLSTGLYDHLPKPRNGAMPSGPVLWWNDKNVLIVSDAGKRLMLNLDTLEIDDAESVPSWSETPLELQEKIVREIDGGLRDTSRWQWKTDSFVERTELPGRDSPAFLSVKQNAALGLFHPERDTRQMFGSIQTDAADRFLCSRDGSKVVVVHGGKVLVYYFELALASPLKWTITMPSSPGDCPDSDAVRAALEAGTLSAFIYAPMSNPLNLMVIGPVREVVKAAVKFEEWKGTTAVVYVSQRFAPIAPGDVIADVVATPDDHAALLSVQKRHHWWMKLPDALAGSEDIKGIPTTEAKMKQLAIAKQKDDDKRKAEEADRKAKNEVEREARKEREAKVAALERERAAAMQPRIERPVQPAPLPPIAPPQGNPADNRVRDFIRAHHLKAAKGDVYGMVSDYAIKVDHFNNGLVDREWILQDELRYHANHTVLEEAVVGDIRVNRLPGGKGYTATYQLKTRTQENATGRLIEYLFEANLIVIDPGTGLQIARQRTEKKP